VQTRLLACLAGGLLGAILTSTVSAGLGVSPLLGFIGCTVAGIALGCLVSILLDVFSGANEDANPDAPK
jgi:hypothetical protein